MKTVILNIAFFLAFSVPAKANVDCIWESSQSGVTIRYIAPCNFSQALLDSFLAKTLLTLNRQDTSLKVLVLVNNGRLSFSGAAFSNFVSVGYDTLRGIDDEFIFDYYWGRGGSIPFDTNNNPIDINSSNNRTANSIGIKIIYDKDYRLGDPDWNDVSRLIIYAVNNVATVRRSQTRDTVRYNTNGWYVSVVTMDTFAINKILASSASEVIMQTEVAESTSKPYFIAAALIVFAILILVFLRRKHRS
jgi:hypothetical protein